MRRLSLDEWDRLVSRHLVMIEAGAEICERHCNQLLGMPDWETQAEGRLALVEKRLADAAMQLHRTRLKMGDKPDVA